MIRTVDTGSTLDGITAGVLNNKGTVQVIDQTRLSLAGVINNTGTINENQTANTGSTQIRIASQNVTLQGGGKLVMSNNTLNQIVGNAASNTLTNVDNTISGAGQIGTSATMTLVNQTKGIINANQTASLTVRTDASIITNAGTMEGTGTGGLVLWNTAVNNAGGTIMAVGAGAHVDLQSEYIEGGLLTTATGGVIRTVDTGSALDGITSGVLSNTGTIQVIDSTRLGLVGVINNTGTINESSTGATTALRIIGNTTLQGAGKLVMSDNVNNQIFGTNASFQLVNVDNVISGAGQIGTSATMSLVNQTKGVINANKTGSLTLRTDANIITNAGTIESTGTTASNGGLVIWNTAVNNAGGTIQALGALAHVDLQSAYIEGGILTTTLKGVVQTVDTGSTLDGITSGVLSNKGTVLVNDHTALSLVGVINNTGTIFEDATSVSGATTVKISGQTATLTGTGQFVMSDNANNVVSGNATAFQLINQGNTISGAGQFGNGGMEFFNQSGVIQGTGTNALVINLGSGNGVNGAGASINAKGAGGVSLNSGHLHQQRIYHRVRRQCADVPVRGAPYESVFGCADRRDVAIDRDRPRGHADPVEQRCRWRCGCHGCRHPAAVGQRIVDPVVRPDERHHQGAGTDAHQRRHGRAAAGAGQPRLYQHAGPDRQRHRATWRRNAGRRRADHSNRRVVVRYSAR